MSANQNDKMKKLISLTAFILLVKLGLSQNPISPPGIYIADPTARVWNDGKLYIYGSADESCGYYCSHRYHMLVTEDMKNWKVVNNVFSSKGEEDEVSDNDNLLFAPSAAYKDGTCYLYYCQPDRKNAEGVATSASPEGPFEGGQPVDAGKYNEIDPDVFIDDDGQVYYLWGQFTLKMAKLKPNMKELDKTSIRDSILTESRHFFHEGAFMTKSITFTTWCMPISAVETFPPLLAMPQRPPPGVLIPIEELLLTITTAIPEIGTITAPSQHSTDSGMCFTTAPHTAAIKCVRPPSSLL